MKKFLYRVFRQAKLVYYSKINRNYDLYENIKLERYIERGLKIGVNTHILECEIDSFFPDLIEIGSNVTITKSMLITHDASIKKELGKSKVGNIKIGNNVFIGAKCIILPNVEIGNNVIIGAGSIVAKNIPENSVAVGNPVQIISTYTEYMKKHKVNIEKKDSFNDKKYVN